MAEILSTGCRNAIAAGHSFRKLFEDAKMTLYSGTAPSTADAAVTGTLLVTVTTSSGTVSVGERSTPKVDEVVIGTHGDGETFDFDVTVDGVGPTAYLYTATTDWPFSHTLDEVCMGIAAMLNDIPQLQAITRDNSDGIILVGSRIYGLTYTLADGGGGTGTITSITNRLAAARSDALYFATASSGAISKTGTWSGTVATSGVAGYFRLVQSDDDTTLSTTQIRLQGTVSTSGAELNLSNTSLVAATTLTIDTFSITQPAS